MYYEKVLKGPEEPSAGLFVIYGVLCSKFFAVVTPLRPLKCPLLFNILQMCNQPSFRYP